MKKIWWLIGILALILLLASVREGFAVSQCPSGFVEDKRIGEGTPMARLRCKKETGEPKCPDGYTMTPFVKMAEGQYNGGTCDKGGESTVARCEGDAMLNVINDKQVCVEYAFVRLGGTETTSVTPQCPAGYQDKSAGRGNNLRCVKEFGDPICPAGSSVESTLNGLRCDDANSTQPVCSSGVVIGRGDGAFICADTKLINKTTSGTTGGTGMSQNTSVSTTTGTTTGGSSTSSFGPNSGGGRRGQVFGPTFNGIGNDGKVRPMDSTKTNSYPELLGGGDSKPSTRIDGAGIVDPSKNWQLANDGSLPNCTSLGCDENSRYFPYSRQPGDMELIPDPYRVSQQFSSASYSFKTEPTPFLTDFSAFLR